MTVEFGQIWRSFHGRLIFLCRVARKNILKSVGQCKSRLCWRIFDDKVIFSHNRLHQMAMTGVLGALRTVYTNGTATCAPGSADEINEDLAIKWFELALCVRV